MELPARQTHHAARARGAGGGGKGGGSYAAPVGRGKCGADLGSVVMLLQQVGVRCDAARVLGDTTPGGRWACDTC